MSGLFVNKRFLIEIIPIIRDKQAWDAFVAIIAHEEERVIAQLNGPKPTDELIRLNANYTLLQRLKKLRETALNAEKEFNAESK